MKITFLGTAAAEGFPAVFCNCPYCQEARVLRGKNIRTRSQTLINDDLLIDLPADTYHHFLQNGIEGDKIQYLLVTHSHSDHFYPEELQMRSGAFAHDMRAPSLHMYCGTGTYQALERSGGVPENVTAEVLAPYQTVTLGKYTVTALPARHKAGDGALFYVIRSDKTLLYAHDTGYFFDEVFSFIEKEKLVFDAVSLDCTNVDISISDEGVHMGLPNIERVLKRLSELGAVTENTVRIINHFSHNANPLQHVLEKRTEGCGYHVAYDGYQLEI